MRRRHPGWAQTRLVQRHVGLLPESQTPTGVIIARRRALALALQTAGIMAASGSQPVSDRVATAEESKAPQRGTAGTVASGSVVNHALDPCQQASDNVHDHGSHAWHHEGAPGRAHGLYRDALCGPGHEVEEIVGEDAQLLTLIVIKLSA